MDLHQALSALKSIRFSEEDGRGPTRLRRASVRMLGGWEEVLHDGDFLPIVTRNIRSNSALSGFSAAPTFTSTWSKRALLDAHGYRDKNGHERALFVELEDLESTQRGFGLQAAYGALEVRERSSRDLICLWGLDTLLEKFGKHERFLCLEFDCSSTKATLSSASIRTRTHPVRTSDDVLWLLKEKFVRVEFRMFITEDHPHCHNAGRPGGQVRDHGAGWRYNTKALAELYDVQTA